MIIYNYTIDNKNCFVGYFNCLEDEIFIDNPAIKFDYQNNVRSLPA